MNVKKRSGGNAHDYAAGICSTLSLNAAGDAPCVAPEVCYTDWYLPALCELGPFGVICTAGSTNIQQQLFENTLIPSSTLGLVDQSYYWSSTQYSAFPVDEAWAQVFNSSGSVTFDNFKDNLLGIRCSRALTS